MSYFEFTNDHKMTKKSRFFENIDSDMTRPGFNAISFFSKLKGPIKKSG